MGRTAKLNKAKVANALHESKGAVYLAAKRLGVSHTSIYTYVKKYEDIADIKNYYDGELVDIGEIALRSAVTNKEPWAVKYILSTKGKDRGYTERSEVTGADGGPVPIRFIDYGLTADDESENETV